MRERNVEVVRSWIDQAWSQGNLTVADDLLTDGFVLHDPVDRRGTHGGDLLGFPSTGRALAVRGVDMYRLEDGRIAESWTFWDLPGMLRAVSAPTAAVTAT